MKLSFKQNIQSDANLSGHFLQMWQPEFPVWHDSLFCVPRRQYLSKGKERFQGCGSESSFEELSSYPETWKENVRDSGTHLRLGNAGISSGREEAWVWDLEAIESSDLITNSDGQTCCYKQQVAPRRPDRTWQIPCGMFSPGPSDGDRGQTGWDRAQVGPDIHPLPNDRLVYNLESHLRFG